MRVFYHHVVRAAERNFEKTVCSKIPLKLVEETVANENPLKKKLLNELKETFPSRDFNCWGAPSQSTNIGNLSPGDIVLLVTTSSWKIPVLCEVKVYRVQIRSSFSYSMEIFWISIHFLF